MMSVRQPRRPARGIAGGADLLTGPAHPHPGMREEAATDEHEIFTDDLVDDSDATDATDDDAFVASGDPPGADDADDETGEDGDDEETPVGLTADDDADDVDEGGDVEEALDVILASRFRSPGFDEDGSDDADGEDDGDSGSGRGAEVIRLQQPDEFLCRGCFLLKRNSQRADVPGLCRDCA